MSASWQLPDDCDVSESLRLMAQAPGQDDDTLIVGLDYRCNNRCRFCLIARERDHAMAHGYDSRRLLQEVLRLNGEHRTYRRLTLSGAEVTLHDALPELVRRALAEGGFEVVRIQTNGRRLADKERLRALIEAGLSECFVSIHADEAALHGRITGAAEGFAELLAGVTNLRQHSVRVISGTVVCRLNHQRLPAVAELLLELGIGESELWSFIELGEAGQAEHHVRFTDAVPPLLAALDRLAAAGSELCVKWFPRCWLGRHAALLDNHQPPMLIQDAFQRRLASSFGFACCYEDECAHFGLENGCLGLSQRYRERFGDEREHLTPLPRGRGPSHG